MKKAIGIALSACLVTLGVATVTATVGTAPASAAGGCSTTPTTSGGPGIGYELGAGSWQSAYGLQEYLLHVPAGLTPGVPVQMVVDLHGGGGKPVTYEQLTGWSSYADAKKNMIVLYPDSQQQGLWNYSPNSTDVQFIKNLTDYIASTYCVDTKRIYVEGHSNGAVMTDRMACDAAGKYAAFAPYQGASSSDPTQGGMGPCTPSRAVPISFIGGDIDTVAPTALQAINRDTWLARQHCASTPVHSSDSYGSSDHYAPCDGSTAIDWRILTNQSHGWPTGAAGTALHDYMMAFFNAHPLP